MNVSLTPELEQFIHSQLESGKYASADEVIRAGLGLLAAWEHIYKGRFEELQREIMLGIEASERGEVVNKETVFHKLLQKLQQRRAQECSTDELWHYAKICRVQNVMLPYLESLA